MENCLECLLINLSIFSLFMRRLREKCFSRVFWEKLSRKHGFLPKNFVSRCVFLFNALVVNFRNLSALRRYFPNSGWLSLTFEMAKFFFQLIIWSYLEPPLLSLLVVLCLISLDFAACSLALHKHVASDVIKRLSTFASLALSTLAPMFNYFCDNVSFGVKYLLSHWPNS